MKSLKISLLAFAVACCGLCFGQTVVMPSLTTTVQNDISTASHPNMARAFDTNRVSVSVNAGDFADSLVVLHFEFFKDGKPFSSYIPVLPGVCQMTMPVGGTDTTWNILPTKGTIPSSMYTFHGNTSLKAVSLGVFTGRPITMDLYLYEPGHYTIKWELYTFKGSKTPYGGGYVSFDGSGVETGLIMEDSIVMDVVLPDFTFNLPTQANVNEWFNCDLKINANSYAYRVGYLGYEVFKAPLGTTSYTNITSSMSNYMTLQVKTVDLTNGTSPFSGDMVNYNRLPGTANIPFVMLDQSRMNITTGDQFYAEGEYMFVFYTVDHNYTFDDTLRIDTLRLTVVTPVLQIPTFTYNFPTKLDTGKTVNATLAIVANDYAAHMGYLGYQGFRADKGTTSYTDITSTLGTYLDMKVEASQGGTVQYSGNMADYNRLPGTATISFGALEAMTINTDITARQDGEYMFVFYTVDQVSATATDTLRIDTILFTVNAPDTVTPSLTLTYTNPLDVNDSTMYRAYDTNIVNLMVTNGAYGDSLVSLYYTFKKDGQIISNLSDYGAMSVKLPTTPGLPLSTDTTYEISTTVDVIPGSTYGYPGYPMDGFTLNLFGGRNIELDIQWFKPGKYTLEWFLVQRALNASSVVTKIGNSAIVTNSTMGDTILSDSLVMNVIVPDFTYPFPTLLDTENVVITTLDITANSYADQNGYMGYQAFQAPLESTSYSDITSSLANYLDVNIDAVNGGTTVFSGNMANYNRIPGSSAISFRTIEDMIITSRVLAKAEGEYMFVFYTIDQVDPSTTDTLRIDTIPFTVKALVLPSIDTIEIVTDDTTITTTPEDTTDYRFADTNKINVGFDVGGYATTLGSLSFKIYKDGAPITSLAEYGSLSFTMKKETNFPFKSDTTFEITTVDGVIPGTTYGYTGYAMDGVTLNLFSGQSITVNALWNKPGKYSIVLELNKRNLVPGSVVTYYTTDGNYASVNNSNKGKLLMTDTITMNIIVPEMTFTLDSIMDTKTTYTDSILVDAHSYTQQNGFYGYQVFYAPLFTSTYSDITASYSTYGTIQVVGKAGSTTVYDEKMTENTRFPSAAATTFENLDTMDITTTTKWNTAGYYMMVFYTVNQTTTGNDTLSIDTVKFIVGATYTKQYKDTICLGAHYGKYGFDTTINTVGTHALLHTFKTVYGCDSNIAVALTILPSYGPTQINASVCRGMVYNANGFMINTRDSVKGTYNYQQMLRTSKGCDSIVNLQLVVNDSALKVIKATICLGDRYNANGFNLLPTAAGDYKYTNFAHTSTGCDSTVDLYLTVNQKYKVSYQDEVCMGSRYTKHGFDTVVTVSTVLAKHLYTTKGCDSIVSVALTVRTQTSRSIYDNICRTEGRYTKNGFNFALPTGISSMVEQMVFQSTYGCDSTVTLYLTINDGGDTTINASLCVGERYASNGIDTTFYMDGTFNVQRLLVASNGCDSAVNFTFVVKPTYSTYETINLCDEDSALYNGVKYGAGTHTIIYPANTVRCDSTLYLTVITNAVVRDTISVNPCRGSQPSYYFGGKELTQDGYYEDTVAVGNCYSIHVLNLTFSDTATRPLAIYGDTNIYTAGSYTYYVDTVPGATSYLWETTDITWTISANNETAVVNIPTPGSGLIMVSSVNACGISSKQSVQVFSAVPVENFAGDEVDVNLFPNPAQNNVTLSVNGMEGEAQIRITDVSGKFIYSDNVEVSSMGSSFNINIADFAKGVYMVSITNEKATVVKKLVVK